MTGKTIAILGMWGFLGYCTYLTSKTSAQDAAIFVGFFVAIGVVVALVITANFVNSNSR